MFVDVEAHAHEMQVGSQTCKSSARALGAARLLKKLPAHFDSERFGAAKGRALVVDVRTRRSLPISSSGDAAASSWSVSQIDQSATPDRVSNPRNNVRGRLVRVQALANPTEQF